jgi:hypothetical protein
MPVLALIAAVALAVTPHHGHARTTFVVSFKAPYAVSKKSQTQYVIGGVHSGTCRTGFSSYGHVNTGPYRKGQTVRFVLRAPRDGWCPGVFRGVVQYEYKQGTRWRSIRLGRYAFRVLAG